MVPAAVNTAVFEELKGLFTNVHDPDSSALAAEHFVKDIGALYPAKESPLHKLLQSVPEVMRYSVCDHIRLRLEQAEIVLTDVWHELITADHDIPAHVSYLLLLGCSSSLAALKVTTPALWDVFLETANPLFVELGHGCAIAEHMEKAGVEHANHWTCAVGMVLKDIPREHAKEGRDRYLWAARDLFRAGVSCVAARDAISQHISSDPMLQKDEKQSAINGMERVFKHDDENASHRVTTFSVLKVRDAVLWVQAFVEAGALNLSDRLGVMNDVVNLKDERLLSDPMFKGSFERLVTSVCAEVLEDRGKACSDTDFLTLIDACLKCQLPAVTSEILTLALTRKGTTLLRFHLCAQDGGKTFLDCLQVLVGQKAEAEVLSLLFDMAGPTLWRNLDARYPDARDFADAVKVAKQLDHPAWKEYVLNRAPRILL